MSQLSNISYREISFESNIHDCSPCGCAEKNTLLIVVEENGLKFSFLEKSNLEARWDLKN